jgi:hypothetical protein
MSLACIISSGLEGMRANNMVLIVFIQLLLHVSFPHAVTLGNAQYVPANQLVEND